MDLDAKRDFNEYANKFRDGNLSIKTVSNFLYFIQRHFTELEQYEFNKLIEIVISIAKNDIIIRDKYEWENERNNEIYKNIAFALKDNDEFFYKYYELDTYELYHFIEILEYLKENFETLMQKDRFYLYRYTLDPLIIAIRDFCVFDNKNRIELNNKLFAMQVEQAINFA